MGKGLLSGVAWGALASVLALGSASVFVPVPQSPSQVRTTPAPSAGGLQAPSRDAAPVAPEAPETVRGAAPGGGAVVDPVMTPPPGSDFARAGEDTQPDAPSAEALPAAPPAPAQPGAAAVVEETVPPAPDTAPPAVPQTATEGIVAPRAPAADDTAPVLPGREPGVTGEVPESAARPEREEAAAPETAPTAPRRTPAVVAAQGAVQATQGGEAVAATASGEAVAASGARARVQAGEGARSPAAAGADALRPAASQRLEPRGEGVAPTRAPAAQATAIAPGAAGAVVAARPGPAPAAPTGATGTPERVQAAVAPSAAASEAPVEPGAAAQEAASAPGMTVRGAAPRVEVDGASEGARAPAREAGVAAPAAAPEELQTAPPGVAAATGPAGRAAEVKINRPAAPAAEEERIAALPPGLTEAPAAPGARLPGRPGKLPRAGAPEAPEAPEAPDAPAATGPQAAAPPQQNAQQPVPAPESPPLSERAPRSGLPGKAARRIGEDNRPSFGKRVVPLTERGQVESRLPSIETAEAEARLSALAANAAPFENTEARPLVSVILVDVGDKGLDRAALQAINFPVTFAIDPTDPGAVEAARSYRAAGFEVLILPTGLPEGARPQDLETTLQTYFARFPDAAGLLDTGADGIQDDPALARQLLAIAADSGHGLVFSGSGLNTALRSAESAGLPAAQVWRELDAAGETPQAIGRSLDRAAFRAAQDGAVVLVGHSSAPTVTSLLAWQAGQKGRTVAFAPVSAVLVR